MFLDQIFVKNAKNDPKTLLQRLKSEKQQLEKRRNPHK